MRGVNGAGNTRRVPVEHCNAPKNALRINLENGNKFADLSEAATSAMWDMNEFTAANVDIDCIVHQRGLLKVETRDLGWDGN